MFIVFHAFRNILYGVKFEKKYNEIDEVEKIRRKIFCIKGRVPRDRSDGNSRDAYFEGREIENPSRDANSRDAKSEGRDGTRDASL